MSNKILFKGKRPTATPFIASLDTASSYDSGAAVVLDSNGAAYVAGSIAGGTGTATTTNGILAKYSLNGNLTWQKDIASSTAVADQAFSCATDASGNIYVVGQAGGASATGYSYLIKFNSAGTLVWQRKFDATVNDTDFSSKVVVNSAGDIFITIQVQGTVQYFYLFKYNSSGTLIKQFKIYQTSSAVIVNSLAIDTNGDVYIAYKISTNAYLMKYSNSLNTLAWTVYLSTGNGFTINDIVCSGTYIYFICNSTTFYMIVKLNTDTGSLVWKYNAPMNFTNLTVDSYDNIYCCGSNYIAKITGNGTLSWINTLSGGNLVGITTDGTANIYVTGCLNTTTTAVMITACLPANGTIPLTGTYTLGTVSTTYAVSSGSMSSNTNSLETGTSATFTELNTNYWARSYEATTNSSRRLYDMTLTTTGVAIAGKLYVGTVAYAFDTHMTFAGVITDKVYYTGTRTDTQANGIASIGTMRAIAVRGGGTGSTDTAAFLTSTGLTKSLGATFGQDEAHDIIYNPATGGFYGIGSTYTSVSVDTLFLLKMGADLSITSGTYFTAEDFSRATLAVDSGNNPIALITAVNSGTTRYVLAKFNTSGVLVWQLEIPSLRAPAYSIATYGTDIYICLSNIPKSGTAATFATIVKLDSSGAVVAAKYVYENVGASTSPTHIYIDQTTGNIFLSLSSTIIITLDLSFNVLRVVQLNNMASKFVCTGTDIYAASEYTIGADYQFCIVKFPQQSSITGTFTDSTGTFTANVVGNPSTAITLTDAVVSSYIYTATNLTVGTAPAATWGASALTSTTTAATSKTILFGVADTAGSLTSANSTLTPLKQLLV